MTRALRPGATVLVGTKRHNIVASAQANRDYGAHVATLVRPYPGGQYDAGSDMWIVAINGREGVAPVSESMMSEMKR